MAKRKRGRPYLKAMDQFFKRKVKLLDIYETGEWVYGHPEIGIQYKIMYIPDEELKRLRGAR